MDNDKRQIEFLLRRATELARTASERSYAASTDFLSLYEQDHIMTHLSGMDYAVEIRTNGGYNYSERRVIEFIPAGVGETYPAPICALRIVPKAAKFAEPLTHRDFLGALLGLGIDRSTLGDILVYQDASAILFCLERIAPYICKNLQEVRHTAVLCSEELDTEQLERLTPDFKTVSGTIASERLDAVLSLAFRISRGNAAELLRSERVHVNGRLVTSVSGHIKPQDVVSVRGFGKFIYDGAAGLSRKERLCVTVRIYH